MLNAKSDLEGGLRQDESTKEARRLSDNWTMASLPLITEPARERQADVSLDADRTYALKTVICQDNLTAK